MIQNGSTIYYPQVLEGIIWETSRYGSPGKLEFSILNNSTLNVQEGNAVRMKYNGQNVFYGFIFTKARSKSETIKITAYDQLRYLKNKDTYVFEKMTASDIVKKIASDFKLNLGSIDSTLYTIPSLTEDNATLFDMIQDAVDETVRNTKKLYVLYDDFGKLCLKNIQTLKLNLVVDDESGEDYDYTSSIDSETYNKVKLIYENDKTKKREVYIAQDSSSMNNWGVLQYFDKIEKATSGKLKVNTLLELYNHKARSLSIKNVFGDVRVHGGVSVIVKLDLGDVKIQNYMIVDNVKHTFNTDEYVMDLTLIGDDFSA